MNPTASNTQGNNTHSYPAYDYPVGIGTGLVAVKDGTIVDFPGIATRLLIGHMQNGQAWPVAGGGSPNSGNVINIDHGNGEITSYLHVTPYDVNAFRGRKVVQGEVFHKSGNNGWSTGPHLHFEVWKNGVRIDPGPWLANIKPGGDIVKPTAEQVTATFNAYLQTPPTAQQQTYYQARDIRDLYNDVLQATKPTATEVDQAFKDLEGGLPTPNQKAYYPQYGDSVLFKDLGYSVKRQYDQYKKDNPPGGGEYVETKVYIKKG